MVKIVIGTTPAIKYTFSIVDPADFAEAILTIKDRLDTLYADYSSALTALGVI